jgi:hypothetical protein
MEWAAKANRASWIELRDSVIRQVIDPDPLVDLVTLLSEREHHSDEGRRREIEGLSTEDRRRMLDYPETWIRNRQRNRTGGPNGIRSSDVFPEVPFEER